MHTLAAVIEAPAQRAESAIRRYASSKAVPQWALVAVGWLVVADAPGRVFCAWPGLGIW
jgi:hypothetical protein